ncbi:hypothetical protein AVEN_117748-1 [Araneus ventricosus]|uniref:Uncharacterized protein n=1 Tax=Araneus ventricosus TaxID=182803 RepID=A0A4Y2BAL2_ARAVE|nr:hypothetical protein AVEN_117748-1 [Araneus ventricosus]
MKIGQAEMKKCKEELKNQIEDQVERQFGEIKDHVNSFIGRIEDVQSVEKEIGEVKDEVQRKIEEVQGMIVEEKGEVQRKISDLDKRFSDLEIRPNNFPVSPEAKYSRPTIKPLTFDGQTPWIVFQTQFDVVRSTTGWTDFEKASQLVAYL